MFKRMNTRESRLEITAVDVRNVKRIAHVHIEPGADAHVLLVAGKNKAGKSSFMDALSIAFFGADAIPDDAVRWGADKAEVEIHLNGGDYLIRRTITATTATTKGKTTLTITGPDGRITPPQAWLDTLVSGRFLDPIGFISRPAKEQRAILLALVGIDVTGLDEERDRLFAERTGVGRLLKQAQAVRAKIFPMTESPADARRISEITAEIEAVAAQRRAADEARAKHVALAGRLATLDQIIDGNHAEISKLEAALVAARATLAANMERRLVGVATVAEAAAQVPTEETFAGFEERRRELQAEANRSENYGRWQATAAATNRQIAAAEAEIRDRSVEQERLTERLKAIDASKAEQLAAAEMPVPDLEVTEDGLKLGGAVFSNASQAEQLRCALAIAMRQAPRLRDVWVRDGSRLDEDEGIDLLRQLAVEMDCRVWVERPGRRDPGAIVIQEGNYGVPQSEVTP
jgi:hypothetical protein